MKKELIFLLLVGITIVIPSVSSLSVKLTPLINNEIQPNTNFDYVFNFTNSPDCSGVVLSYSDTITTNNYGYTVVNIDLDGINQVPSFICEYRNEFLRKVHNYTDNLVRDLYGRNLNFSGNANISGTISTMENILINGSSVLTSYTESDPLWTANQSSYVPYSGATSNLDLGSYGIYASNFKDNGDDVYVGSLAGGTDSADYVVGVGYGAAFDNSGDFGTFVGYASGYNNRGHYTTAVGAATNYIAHGDNVTSLGYYSNALSTGSYVIGLGIESLFSNSGDNVIALGYKAGLGNSANNKFIVQQANVNSTELIYGDFATGQVNASDFCTYGGNCLSNAGTGTGTITGAGTSGNLSVWNGTSSITNSVIYQLGGNIGINTTDPQNTLNVIGTFNVTNGSGTLGLYQNEYGRVGIGPLVLNPGALLSIGGNGESGALSVEGVGGTNIATFRDSDGENIFTARGTLAGSDFVLHFGDWGEVYGLPYFDVNSENISFMNGNVGIGTKTPQNKLNVIGDGNFTGKVIVQDNLDVNGNTTILGYTNVSGLYICSNATATIMTRNLTRAMEFCNL